MTDFLSHLVDAPLANILIIAGLLFLGIGAVGKVTGKIEPDKFGRLMVSLLGVVLLAVGIVTHIRGDSSSKSQNVVEPVIRSFSVKPAQVTKGGKVTIRWDVQNADDVELKPLGQVSATGDEVVHPDQTTIYSLSATNKGGGKSGTFQEVIVEKKTNSKSGKESPETSEENPPADDNDEGETVYATDPPPDLPDYAQPSASDDSYLWTPGSWYYSSAKSDYYWVPGEWVVPPLADWLWTPPYWGYNGTRYEWHVGYWSTSVGFYGGIDYGFGYTGSGYDRSKRNITSANRVSYNGGPHGVQKTRAPLELVAERDRHPALSAQMHLVRDAKNNREQYSRVNHGRPQTVVVAKLRDSSLVASPGSTPPSHPVHPSTPPSTGSTPPSHPVHPSTPPSTGSTPPSHPVHPSTPPSTGQRRRRIPYILQFRQSYKQGMS